MAVKVTFLFDPAYGDEDPDSDSGITEAAFALLEDELTFGFGAYDLLLEVEQQY